MFGIGERPRKFATPEEELAYLRAEVAKRERAYVRQHREATEDDRDRVALEAVEGYTNAKPERVLAPALHMDRAALSAAAERVSASEQKIDEIVRIAAEKGIRNALEVLAKAGDPYLADEVHRELVAAIRKGRTIANFKEGAPQWNNLHMTLFEVALPEQADQEDSRERTLAEIISAMEQFYAGMRSVVHPKTGKPEHFTIEIAVEDDSDDIVFYAAVPNAHVDLFEKQVLSLFPDAVLAEQQQDYNIFVEGGASIASVASLRKDPIWPLKTYDAFDHDPLRVLLNAFSKIEREGGGASVQIVMRAGGDRYTEAYQSVIRRVRDGMPAKKAIALGTMSGELVESVKDIFKSKEAKEKEKEKQEVDQDALDQFGKKVDAPILETNIRVAVSAGDQARARQILSEIESSFNQFENTKGNRIEWQRLEGARARESLRQFSFREFSAKRALPLTSAELTTLIHFPTEGLKSSPQFRQTRAKTAPAPLGLPADGTLIGVNSYRGRETAAYITPEDRLRHVYVIGQTGTGKTTLMKNMIIDDIREGSGVCFIDPHGTDIADVLAAVPPERRGDVIYFDPSRTDRVIGLNMLEFDPARPEQKTFVVNELFSIFQKLYGKVPESMGPIFEQYFRNATLLVLEDPESGSTLLDISRVMADADYRKLKLAKATNPVVVEFWNKIATQAGGEAALENIVPYITSKFDVFTANDYMRPIIGQQESSFDFRALMDEKKILLVNLSKGRLGEINANLIGMIVVGKILMAALSRVDDPSRAYAPFYLHIDEFQNVTTNSISEILSEARKYKLGLTIAHQFIAQLEEGIRDAVFGNAGSVVAFRVGAEDAEFLESQFAPVFNAHDLMNIENYHAYVRLLAHGTPAKPFNVRIPPPAAYELADAEEVIRESLARYAVPRRMVEMDIAARYAHAAPLPTEAR